jgi:uncharacterized protein
MGTMEQRVSLITLGVDHLARSKAFYEALGWTGQEVEETVFIQAGGLAVVLWGRADLAKDAGVESAGERSAFGGIALAHNVRSPGEVDEIMATAQRGGATVTRAAESTSYGGYAGYFADPDGHLWEVAHNPGFALSDDGALTLPDFSRTSPAET